MTMMIQGRPVPKGPHSSQTFHVHGLLMQANLLFCLCALVMGASLLLGGGTRSGFLSDAILQLIAIPLLLTALWKMFDVELAPGARRAAWFCLLIIAVPLIQLIPLPPLIWTALPGREASIETFEILGHGLPWMPISVSPNETWLSALSLIPPIGVFLGTLLLGYEQRRLLVAAALAVGLVSVFVGLLQVAQGPESALRFFEFTNDAEAVGFFANRNHFAALLYTLLLFAAAWAGSATAAGGIGRRLKDYDARTVILVVGCFTILVILLAGQAMARSRAGLGLTIIALLGAFALGISDRRVGSSVTSTRVIVFASLLAVIFTVQYALYRIMERFVVDPLQDARIPFAGNTVDAAMAYMPLGSGLGTFVPVYAMHEGPTDVIADTYANHAHNDLLELWLNTGIVGPVLLAVFLAWLVQRSLDIWRRGAAGATELDWSLARAASIVVVLLLAHSFVDYPLRTGAMMAVLALACSLLIEPPLNMGNSAVKKRPAARKLGSLRSKPKKTSSREMPSRPLQAQKNSSQPVLSFDHRWGTDMNWPKEWSSNSSSDAPERMSEAQDRRDDDDTSGNTGRS